MASDDHPEPEQRALQAADPVQESAEHRQVAVVRERAVASTASMPDLTWREWFLFGCTGGSILVALITAAIVLSDMSARGSARSRKSHQRPNVSHGDPVRSAHILLTGTGS